MSRAQVTATVTGQGTGDRAIRGDVEDAEVVDCDALARCEWMKGRSGRRV